MSLETEKQFNNVEQERSYETKETKERDLSPEAAAAAMKERAEFLVKEVKNNQTMMQNILMNMAQVKQLIQKIRAQLQLAQQQDESQSVQEDAKYVEELKKQIADHKKELINMREDLIHIYSEDIKQQQPELTKEQVNVQAATFVDNIINQTQQ